jgi:hypothetical protein
VPLGSAPLVIDPFYWEWWVGEKETESLRLEEIEQVSE